ncbi:MAG: TRAP transporter large permease [Dehalobacterium sp.]
MEILALFMVFALLLITRVPIAFALGISSLTILMFGDFNLVTVFMRMFSGIQKETLMAIPGFVFTGIVMSRGGIAVRLIDTMKAWVCHFTGGMALVTVVATMFFAAISGSSAATAAAIGSIMIPAMVKNNYSKQYSMGLVAASGTLGIIIPPSLNLIIYASVTGASVGDLFIAGIIPGLLMGGVICVSTIIYAKRKGFGQITPISWSHRWKVTGNAIWALLLPVLILGTIYSGVVTPTEASVVSGVYAVLVSVLIYKEVKFRDIKPILTETIHIVSMIFLIIACAQIFSMFLTINQVPQYAAQWISEHGLNRWSFLALCSLLFFILGMFLEGSAVTLITIPILFPIINYLGIDLVHFGIFFMLNLEISLITPPVGLNLFVVSGIANERIETAIRGIVPYIFLMFLVVFIVAVYPGLTLFLTNL